MRVRHKHNNEEKTPYWNDNMSIIERFILITSPILLAFMIYMMCDGMEWWYRLTISISVTILLRIVIHYIANWLAERDWDY